MISKKTAIELAMLRHPGDKVKQDETLKQWSHKIVACPPEICELCEFKAACGARS